MTDNLNEDVKYVLQNYPELIKNFCNSIKNEETQTIQYLLTSALLDKKTPQKYNEAYDKSDKMVSVAINNLSENIHSELRKVLFRYL